MDVTTIFYFADTAFLLVRQKRFKFLAMNASKNKVLRSNIDIKLQMTNSLNHLECC